MQLLLATRNADKTREFRELLGHDFEVIDLSSFPEIAIPEETGRTFKENAALKAIAASEKLASLVVADDSGLEVDALDGAPGIYSARYAGENASAGDSISKLLRELSARNIADEKRSARFRCVTALAQNGKLLGTFEGAVEGNVVDPPRGNGGFGYDPVFEPTGFEQTFAEMPRELKNKISHRAQAIAALREGFRDIPN
ncbi:MAG TPA: RdgB/HAM1 family non-canonical purine NTP pyrophosphatase [Chthoniobacterales bacterium]|jgi:XTP/dITP diphosphohydrolase|nr:RdgB/HAM1 family non-canonical purine NTP pyrophosphatase [Chthoniobacterales bacterium]